MIVHAPAEMNRVLSIFKYGVIYANASSTGPAAKARAT